MRGETVAVGRTLDDRSKNKRYNDTVKNFSLLCVHIEVQDGLTATVPFLAETDPLFQRDLWTSTDDLGKENITPRCRHEWDNIGYVEFVSFLVTVCM